MWLYFASCDPLGGSRISRERVAVDACVTQMAREQLQLHYSGRVQGVGFRATAKRVAHGYEVTGTVRNLPDGRVEMVVEGERRELEAFQQAIRESGLGHFIRLEETRWVPARNEFRGFEIVR